MKTKNALMRLKPTKRRIIQLYAALLYNAQLKGFTEGQIYTGKLKNVCVPGLNCYSCPGAVAACPLGALQNALASSTTRLPAYMLGIIILFGLALGRTICGFLCPFGLIQELLYKIPSPKLKKNKVTHALSYLKYVILGIFVVLIPLYFAFRHLPLPAFCKYICPAGTLEGAIGLLANPKNTSKLSMLGVLFTNKFVIMVLILAASVFIFRVFCRFLCPLGAIYGFFCKLAMVGVKVDLEKCTDCGLCVRTCKMDVKHVGDHECINCGACMRCCPHGAISYKVAGKTIQPKDVKEKLAKKEGRALPPDQTPLWKKILPWTLALLLLAGVMIYVNMPQKKDNKPGAPVTSESEVSNESSEINGEEISSETGDDAVTESESASGTEESGEESSEPMVEAGKEVGMRLPDFTCTLYSEEGEFSTADFRGKILIINFWATWCTPCVNELPHFEAIGKEYAGDVQIVALHSSLVTEDVQAWIDREGHELTFGLDEYGIIESLGGSTILPMTVVVNRDGIITYNAEGSVTLEKLQTLVEEAMNME